MTTYDAFVSYCQAKDKPIATALQSVVQKLGKPWYWRRALRVFRDDTSLSATPGLWPSIERALGRSRFFILLASPEAAASKWVNKEVAYWLDHKSIDTLLVGVTDGELAWDETVGDFAWGGSVPLPPVLTGRFASEPRWVDLRAYRDDANPSNAKFIELAANFAAAIHGMPKEDLLSQEVRQQRLALTLAWSAIGSLLILAGLAIWESKMALDAERAAVEQKQTAQKQRDRAIAAEELATEQTDIARTQRDRAERNFAIAKRAADDVVFSLARDLRNVQGIRLELLRRILNTAQTLMDQLANAAADDYQLQRSRAEMLDQFAEIYLAAGDLTRARTAAEESLDVRRKLTARDPENADSQRNLCLALDKIGDVRLTALDRAGALVAYEESLAIRRKFANVDPNNTWWRHDLDVSLIRVGDMRRDAGDQAGALAAYEESLAIMRKLAAADPDRDMSVGLNRVGEMRLRSGDLAGALAAYEESLAIRRKLANSDPGNVGWQSDIGVSLEMMGDVRRAAGDRTGALAAYEESLAIRRKLAASDPENAGWQRNVSLNKVGNVKLDAGDRAGALAAYEEDLVNTRKLVALNPGNSWWQEDLFISLYKVSTASDPPRARAVLREALPIVDAFARAGKLAPAQQNWPQMVRDALSRLPPEAADAR